MNTANFQDDELMYMKDMTCDVTRRGVDVMRNWLRHRSLAALRRLSTHGRPRQKAALTWFGDFKAYLSVIKGSVANQSVERAADDIGRVMLKGVPATRLHVSEGARASAAAHPAVRLRSPRPRIGPTRAATEPTVRALHVKGTIINIDVLEEGQALPSWGPVEMTVLMIELLMLMNFIVYAGSYLVVMGVLAVLTMHVTGIAIYAVMLGKGLNFPKGVEAKMITIAV